METLIAIIICTLLYGGLFLLQRHVYRKELDELARDANERLMEINSEKDKLKLKLRGKEILIETANQTIKTLLDKAHEQKKDQQSN